MAARTEKETTFFALGPSAPLSGRLLGLTGLRLAVLTIFLAITATLYLGGFRAGGYSTAVAVLGLAAAFAAALVYAVLLRSGRALPAVAHAQLVTDQVTWTVFVYITGGATSGGTSLYGLTCLSGAIVLGARGAWLAAGSGIAGYVALCAGFMLDVLQAPPDQPREAYVSAWADVRYPMFVNVLGIALVALLASYLAERLRATGGRLAQVTARAEEAEKLAHLAAALAHEIRNPLGSIAGSIELLSAGETLTDQDRELCAIVQRETRRLNDLVGDMLTLSRPRQPQKEELDLVRVVRDVVALAGRSGRGTDVGVRYEGPEAFSIVADPSQMQQVLWNLVRNAVQASSAGDVVELRLARGDESWILSVEDHGPGIPEEARAHLFEAFYTTRPYGTGIGLAVVKRILDDHQLPIEVKTGERGTRFEVRIPTPPEPSGPGAV